MKKFFYLLSISIILFSCESGDSSPQVIGFTADQDGVKTDVIAGPSDTVSIWENYIEAHNSRDMDAIRNLNSDDFSAYGEAGQVVEGSDAHIGFLSEWFEISNPKWKVLWAISNSGYNVNNDMADFVTAGHELVMSVDGEEVTLYQVIDAMIADGKIVNFNVYQQERGQASTE